SRSSARAPGRRRPLATSPRWPPSAWSTRSRARTIRWGSCMACSPDAPLPDGTAADRPWLDALFLGPYGENDALLEKLVVEFLRDHVYCRRNFHPEYPPAISTHAALHPEYQALEARLRRELHQLSAALKRSVPFHSPRYIGHMASDLLLPGLAAQI